jgi:ADP-ribose pyrophosphatase YjhB (NUDIX family)
MLMKLAAMVWKLMPWQARTFVTRVVQVRFTVSAAGIITNQKGEVLLLNHFLRPVSGWGVPGGFVNFGENAETAFLREVCEETGLDLTDVVLYRTRTLKRHIEIIFIARSDGEPTVKSREIIELGWFALNAMPAGMSQHEQQLIRTALADDE